MFTRLWQYVLCSAKTSWCPLPVESGTYVVDGIGKIPISDVVMYGFFTIATTVYFIMIPLLSYIFDKAIPEPEPTTQDRIFVMVLSVGISALSTAVILTLTNNIDSLLVFPLIGFIIGWGLLSHKINLVYLSPSYWWDRNLIQREQKLLNQKREFQNRIEQLKTDPYYKNALLELSYIDDET